MNDEIIFHAYPQSPMAEKVRVAFGLKGLSWRSVTVPRIPPKPKLFALTGGYRRVPVMQIGADIYCDTLCILRNLERLYPETSLSLPQGGGLGWSLSRWIDGDLFKKALAIILGHQAETLDPAFANDRGRLYFGPNFDLLELKKNVPSIAADIRSGLTMTQEACDPAGPFFFGKDPSLVDVYAYFILWFLRGRWDRGPEFLSQFPRLNALEEAVAARGHGTSAELSEDEALDIARAAGPKFEASFDEPESLNVKIGDAVDIRPEGDGGDPAVTGTLVAVSATELTILRQESAFELGELALHFPRSGYLVDHAK